MTVAYPNPSAPPWRGKLLAVLFAAVCLLAGVGFWTYHAVREGVRNQLAAGLGTILDGNITALGIWISNEKADVQTWAADNELRLSLTRLIDQAATDPAGLRQSPEQHRLHQILATAVADVDYRGFAAIDQSGLIVAAGPPEKYVGRMVSDLLRPFLDRVLGGETLFVRPLPKRAMVDGAAAGGLPVIMVAAPVRGKDIPFAALVFTIDPEKDFSRILSAARAGETGDTYAFDRFGRLLSESRHEGQLEEIGLLPDQTELQSVLAIEIRDPGGDLLAGYQPAQPPGAWPLTRMAASATSGKSGMDLEGYRDYRGVTVVGAWRWLPEYDLGVASEVNRAEALSPLRPIRVAFWGLSTLLFLLAMVILASGWFIGRLRRQIAEIRQLGQYTLVEKIGEGGMGTVYRARHALLRRPTAIKLIKSEQADAAAIARFEKEVQLTSELTHPNTISVYDYGRTPEGVFYYAMEYLPGINLAQLVNLEKTVPPARVAHILRQTCASLVEAHGLGLIHRDIKPQNIFLCERGGVHDVVKVLDFGLVQETSRPDPAEAAGHGVFGSPGYIAPERLTAPDRTDARADLYSLGAVGFFLLTGEIPFPGASNAEICNQVVHAPPPRPSQRFSGPVPSGLDELIFNCLAKKSADRPKSAADMLLDLESIPLEDQWTSAAASRWWQENLPRIQVLQQAARQPVTAAGSRDRSLAIDWKRRPGSF